MNRLRWGRVTVAVRIKQPAVSEADHWRMQGRVEGGGCPNFHLARERMRQTSQDETCGLAATDPHARQDSRHLLMQRRAGGRQKPDSKSTGRQDWTDKDGQRGRCQKPRYMRRGWRQAEAVSTRLQVCRDGKIDWEANG